MEQYNVLLLTIDCFRFDRIQTNGYMNKTTPNLDYFINNEAINFTHTIASGPSTMAAFPGLFTSSYPVMYGGSRYLSKDRTTIAEIFSQEGYECIGLSSNPYITPEFGYDRGFSIFWDSVQRTRVRDKKINLLSKVISRDSTLWNVLRKMARGKEIHRKKSLYPTASKMNEKLLETITCFKEKKSFFAWCHYMDLHYPYDLASIDLSSTLSNIPSDTAIATVLAKLMEDATSLNENEKKIVNGIYDASLIYIDEQLGSLFEKMKEIGIWENTILVITADHGEELLEKGRFGHGDEGMDSSFSESLLHIPFMLKLPDDFGKGIKKDALVSQVDIPVTLLSLLGIDIPKNWYGLNLLPLIEGGKKIIREATITQRGVEHSFAIAWRTNKWKLIYNAFKNEKKLYQLSVNPHSEDDVLYKFSGKGDELYNQILVHLKEHEKAYSKKRLANVDLDEGIKKRLKSLGYM